MLEIRGARKSFGTVVAVRDIDLTIAAGEYVALVGPSGCGKSTLLRVVAGLEAQDAGHVSFFGVLWDALTPQQRNVAMVFQNLALYPHRTVAGNIDYPLRVAGLPAEERGRRVREIATLLGISELLERKPKQISGGEAQRVALARALVRQPACFLLDEPLGSLDAQMRLRARGEIKRIQRDLSVTTLHVTHDQDEAIALGDRVGVMRAGELVQVGTPEELVRRPKSVFVAGFIGTPPTILIPAIVHDRVIRLVSPAGDTWAFAPVPEHDLPSHGELVIGVAPDRARLAGELLNRPVTEETFRIRVDSRIVEGVEPEVVVHCSTPIASILVRATRRPSEDETVLELPVRDALVFDRRTGLRLEGVRLGRN